VNEQVMRVLRRGALAGRIGKDNFFWSADQAIRAAEERHPCPYCARTPREGRVVRKIAV
jgi:hypothetical protein